MPDQRCECTGACGIYHAGRSGTMQCEVWSEDKICAHCRTRMRFLEEEREEDEAMFAFFGFLTELMAGSL